MPFTDDIWQQIQGIYAKIQQMPFNRELMQGTLDKEKFSFYIHQDALYLADFSRALSLVAARSAQADDVLDFIRFANDAIVVERALHQGYFQKFNIPEAGEKSPTCFSYTNFLLATCCLKNYEVAVAALLPCFWIYQEIGQYIRSQAQRPETNPYQEWIDTYSGEAFLESVDKMLRITNRLAEQSSLVSREAMRQAFICSARLEYMFWDSAYQQENWAV
ncbi:MAG: thiaminase II [Bacteroidia bacterium]|nr:thiaminase II [Bacteroidia bacterium]